MSLWNKLYRRIQLLAGVFRATQYHPLLRRKSLTLTRVKV